MRDLFSAIKSGASGYLLKTGDTDKFFKLLEGLMEEGAAFSRACRTGVGRICPKNKCSRIRELGEKAGKPLTSRQIQVLTLVAQGLTYKEIGSKLFLSERTIKYHMGEIIERLHLDNRRQVIDYARAMNFKIQ